MDHPYYPLAISEQDSYKSSLPFCKFVTDSAPSYVFDVLQIPTSSPDLCPAVDSQIFCRLQTSISKHIVNVFCFLLHIYLEPAIWNQLPYSDQYFEVLSSSKILCETVFFTVLISLKFDVPSTSSSSLYVFSF